jgi:hypothetical protein
VKEYPAIETGLSLLPMLPPDTAAELLERRGDALAAEVTRRRADLDAATRAGLPELLLIETHYRVAVLDAERAFVAELAASIRRGSIGGAEWWRQLHELLADGLGMDDIRSRASSGAFGEEAATLLGN